jgi:hypothetical protein
LVESLPTEETGVYFKESSEKKMDLLVKNESSINLDSFYSNAMTLEPFNSTCSEPKSILPIPSSQRTCICCDFDSTKIEEILLQFVRDPLFNIQTFKVFVSMLDFDMAFNYFDYDLRNIMENLNIEKRLFNFAQTLASLCEAHCYELIFYIIKIIQNEQNSLSFVVVVMKLLNLNLKFINEKNS